MSASPVERLYGEYEQVRSALREAGQPSLESWIVDTGRKALLLAAASNFEHRLTTSLSNFAAGSAPTSLALFVQNKGISRQYHTYFDWEKKNANKFFSLFGQPFKEYMEARVDDSATLPDAVRAFLV